jgi:hypothetical protein
MMKLNDKHELLINVMVDSFGSYDFFNKFSELSDKTITFLKPSINFRVFEEDKALGIKSKLKPKQCI